MARGKRASDGRFFVRKRVEFQRTEIDAKLKNIEWVNMPDGEDFLWRPVLSDPPVFPWELVFKDRTIDLIDIAEAHDALDIKLENQRRVDAALRKR